MFPLVSYPTHSQEKFKDAYKFMNEKSGTEKREKNIFWKLNIKDNNVFKTNIYTITVKIFICLLKKFKKFTPF